MINAKAVCSGLGCFHILEPMHMAFLIWQAEHAVCESLS